MVYQNIKFPFFWGIVVSPCFQLTCLNRIEELGLYMFQVTWVYWYLSTNFMPIPMFLLCLQSPYCDEPVHCQQLLIHLCHATRMIWLLQIAIGMSYVHAVGIFSPSPTTWLGVNSTQSARLYFQALLSLLYNFLSTSSQTYCYHWSPPSSNFFWTEPSSKFKVLHIITYNFLSML